MAGLAAARQLRASGHSVIILEGNGRAGGRVYTRRLEVGLCWPAAMAIYNNGWLIGCEPVVNRFDLLMACVSPWPRRSELAKAGLKYKTCPATSN